MRKSLSRRAAVVDAYVVVPGEENKLDMSDFSFSGVILHNKSTTPRRRTYLHPGQHEID